MIRMRHDTMLLSDSNDNFDDTKGTVGGTFPG